MYFFTEMKCHLYHIQHSYIYLSVGIHLMVPVLLFFETFFFPILYINTKFPLLFLILYLTMLFSKLIDSEFIFLVYSFLSLKYVQTYIPTTIKVHSNSSLPPNVFHYTPLCFPLIVMTESHSNTWQLQNLLSETSVLFLRILCKWTHIKGNL